MKISFWIAQCFGAIGAVSNVVSTQLNKRSQILIAYTVANCAYGINFLLLDAYTGAITCFIAGIETIINGFYDRKNKNVPIILLTIYLVIAIIAGVNTYARIIDIMPIISSLIYIILITIKKESSIRNLNLINMILWTIYDFLVMAYAAAISDFAIVISTLIGIYRYDFKKIEKYNRRTKND